jgi:hypothetical protein
MRKTLESTESMLGRKADTPTSRQDLFTASSALLDSNRHTCWWKDDPDGIEAPVALIPSLEDSEALFADIATYYSHQVPLTAYTHLLSAEIANIAETQRIPERELPMGALLGLCFGEVLSSAATPGFADVSLYSAARRTLTFAVARAHLLYPEIDLSRIAARWQAARVTGGMGIPTPMVASALWISNSILHAAPIKKQNDGVDVSLHADIRRYLRASLSASELTQSLVRLYPTLAPGFSQLLGAFDTRINVFERMSIEISSHSRGPESDAFALAFACDRLAPGTLDHANLLQRFAPWSPGATLWYGALAGAASEFRWRSAFAGIGQKLARDLYQPLDIRHRPTCDIALEEFEVLSRAALRVEMLKPFQQRICIVALLPGVDTFVRTPTETNYSPPSEDRKSAELASKLARVTALLRDAMTLLADRPDTLRSDKPAPKKGRASSKLHD